MRFTLNPKYIIWSTDGWQGLYQNNSFLGKRDVKSPDYAFKPASQKLGIFFDNDSSNSPFKKIDGELKIASKRELPAPSPLNSLNIINDEFVASSKYSVYFMDREFNIKDELEIDPYFSATIDPIIGVVPYKEDKYLLMGSNKTLLRFAKNPAADDRLQYADFVKGADKFEGQGDDLGRSRVDTVRAKFHHIASIATDGEYLYTATVPNNKDTRSLIISKILAKDRVLSGEFAPAAELKEGSSLGDLYITAMAHKNGKLFALSKNHNVIAVIDIKSQIIERTISYPSEIKNARALLLDGDKTSILSYQDGQNILFELR